MQVVATHMRRLFSVQDSRLFSNMLLVDVALKCPGRW
jgi:hypothetical protein